MVDCNRVLLAIGQGPDLTWMSRGSEGIGATKQRRLAADAVTFSTGRPGVFGTGEISTTCDALSSGGQCAGNGVLFHNSQISFRDITSGNNGASCLVGFDLCSGRGSWTGTTKNGKAFSHTADFTATWDSAAKCVTRDGSAQTMIILSTIGGFFSAGCSQASFCSTLARMLR